MARQTVEVCTSCSQWPWKASHLLVHEGKRLHPCAACNLAGDFEETSSLAFGFSSTTGTVSMNSFIIHNDDVLEDDEVFLGTFVIPPLVQATKGNPSLTRIVIRDDDSESHVQCNPAFVCKHPVLSSAAVTVNFNSTHFTVSELSGSLQVFLEVEGKFAVSLAATVHCRAMIPESARGEAALIHNSADCLVQGTSH